MILGVLDSVASRWVRQETLPGATLKKQGTLLSYRPFQGRLDDAEFGGSGLDAEVRNRISGGRFVNSPICFSLSTLLAGSWQCLQVLVWLYSKVEDKYCGNLRKDEDWLQVLISSTKLLLQCYCCFRILLALYLLQHSKIYPPFCLFTRIGSPTSCFELFLNILTYHVLI